MERLLPEDTVRLFEEKRITPNRGMLMGNVHCHPLGGVFELKQVHYCCGLGIHCFAKGEIASTISEATFILQLDRNYTDGYWKGFDGRLLNDKNDSKEYKIGYEDGNKTLELLSAKYRV